jgi:flagellar biosynthetic protein FliR
MELFNMATLYYDRFIPVFIRIAVMISFIPFIGAAMTPLFVRAGFVLAFTLLVLPVANVDTANPVKALFDAFFIGSAMGLSIRLIMSAIETAAQWMSIQMGFGMAAVFNPQFGEQLGPLSLFYTYMGMVMFFMLGIHHVFIEGVMRSFEIGTLRFNSILQAILVLNSYFFPLALKIAAPVLLVQTVIIVANGFVAKTMPQANIFFVGMPLQIMLGFLFIIASMSLSLMVIGRSFMHIKDAIETITR